jgi:hypothetical protein
MKRYKVLATVSSYVETTIEIEDDEDEWTFAKNMDGSDFKNSGSGDWEITSVEEIK